MGNNGSGDIYRIDLTTDPGADYDESRTILFSTGPSSSVNDGARCVNAPVYLDAGDAPDDGAKYNYNTLFANDGARHGLFGYDSQNSTANLMLGSVVDADMNGMPVVTANASNDDEAVIFSGNRSAQSITARVDITNNTGQPANVCAWLDVPPQGGVADGVFDAADGQCQSTSNVTDTLTFSWNVPTDQAYDTYARFRITTDSLTAADAGSPKNDGEVEDYFQPYNLTPTAVTIANVQSESVGVTDFLSSLAVEESVSLEGLQALLRSWDADHGALVAGDRQSIMDALEAYLDPDGDGALAILRWQTLVEQGTVGFYVERKTGDGRWVRISRELLPSLLSPLGGHYQMIDPQARSR